jgi:hypothetical protein
VAHTRDDVIFTTSLDNYADPPTAIRNAIATAAVQYSVRLSPALKCFPKAQGSNKYAIPILCNKSGLQPKQKHRI